MSVEILEERLEAALPQLRSLNAAVKFDLGADGSYVVDARAGQPSLSQDADGDADCTIRISGDNLIKLLNGKLDPMLAYTMGKIKVSGSMGIAMKLVSALG